VVAAGASAAVAAPLSTYLPDPSPATYDVVVVGQVVTDPSQQRRLRFSLAA